MYVGSCLSMYLPYFPVLNSLFQHQREKERGGHEMSTCGDGFSRGHSKLKLRNWFTLTILLQIRSPRSSPWLVLLGTLWMSHLTCLTWLKVKVKMLQGLRRHHKGCKWRLPSRKMLFFLVVFLNNRLTECKSKLRLVEIIWRKELIQWKRSFGVISLISIKANGPLELNDNEVICPTPTSNVPFCFFLSTSRLALISHLSYSHSPSFSASPSLTSANLTWPAAEQDQRKWQVICHFREPSSQLHCCDDTCPHRTTSSTPWTELM